MLSAIILSAITAVALPSLRITTLSMVRVISLSAILIVYGVAGTISPSLGLYNNMSSSTVLFDGVIIADILGQGAITLILFTIAICLVHYTSQTITTHNTSYTLTILVGIILLGSYYLATSSDLVTFALFFLR